MAVDAEEGVLAVRVVRRAQVVLDDHYASGEINTGVNEEEGFDGAFPGETESPDLEELRTVFRRKCFVARQEKLCRALLAGGYSPEKLAKMRLGEVPEPQGGARAGRVCGGAADGRPRGQPDPQRRGCGTPQVRPNNPSKHRRKRRDVPGASGHPLRNPQS